MPDGKAALEAWEPPARPWRKVDDAWLPPEFDEAQQAALGLSGPHGDVCSEAVIEAARAGLLVPFVGAGVSCIPPTSLPSWKVVDQSVLRAVRDRAAQIDRAHNRLFLLFFLSFEVSEHADGERRGPASM